MCSDAQSLLKFSSRTICFLTSGFGSVVIICRRKKNVRPESEEIVDTYSEPTFNANTVFAPFSMHRVTAPPAPSPRLPSSTILPCSLAANHPSSSRSSTSRGLPFSRLSLSRSGRSPFILLSRSIATPPSTELIADDGSGVPPRGFRRPMANERAEYVDDDADAGPLPFPSRFVKLPVLECPFASPNPGICSGGGRPLCNEPPSRGVSCVPMGVASLSCGGAGRPAGRCSLGPSRTVVLVSGLTGLTLGEGGIPSVNRGVREPLLRLPGTGGLRRGAGDDIVRLFCPSQGRNSSFGSARAG